MEQGFLFREDRERQAREWEALRRSLIFGTPEFWFAYAQYIRSAEWRKLCRLVKERARNRCERYRADDVCQGRLSVHHLTYDRFKRERLSDLQLLCARHHVMADREREEQNREAFELAGEEARDAAGMNTYFTKRYGDDWSDRFGSDIESAYEEWDDWKRRKAEEEGNDYY